MSTTKREMPSRTAWYLHDFVTNSDICKGVPFQSVSNISKHQFWFKDNGVDINHKFDTVFRIQNDLLSEANKRCAVTVCFGTVTEDKICHKGNPLCHSLVLRQRGLLNSSYLSNPKSAIFKVLQFSETVRTVVAGMPFGAVTSTSSLISTAAPSTCIRYLMISST